MIFSQYQCLVIFIFVASGSLTTINTKFMNSCKSESIDGKVRKFQHPFFQTGVMFLGEMSCLLPWKILLMIFRRREDGYDNQNVLTRGSREFNRFLYALPAVCDMFSTFLQFTGLNLTYASSYQMLRGASIIFCVILSIILFKKVFKIIAWSGILLVILGLFLVGLGDMLSEVTDIHSIKEIITGDILIALAQFIRAIQLISEEKFTSEMDVSPLHAVGLEGAFGFAVVCLLLLPFHFIEVPPPFTNNARGVLEDVYDAAVQIKNNYLIGLLCLFMIILAAFYNFAAMTLTKEVSATTNVLLDCIRTIIVWLISLGFLGEQFLWVKLLGVIILTFGICWYNNLLVAFKCCKKEESEEAPPI